MEDREIIDEVKDQLIAGMPSRININGKDCIIIEAKYYENIFNLLCNRKID